MAVMRAGLTNWHAGNIEVGHGMICKAYAILLVTHGPSHPITKDLEASSMSGLSFLFWSELSLQMGAWFWTLLFGKSIDCPLEQKEIQKCFRPLSLFYI